MISSAPTCLRSGNWRSFRAASSRAALGRHGFRAAGFVSDGEPMPVQPLEVWRSQVGHVWGLSWIRDRERAEWFHERNQCFGKSSRLLHGMAPPEGVLGIISGPKSRRENEVIVDPAFMRRAKEERRDD